MNKEKEIEKVLKIVNKTKKPTDMETLLNRYGLYLKSSNIEEKSITYTLKDNDYNIFHINCKYVKDLRFYMAYGLASYLLYNDDLEYYDVVTTEKELDEKAYNLSLKFLIPNKVPSRLDYEELKDYYQVSDKAFHDRIKQKNSEIVAQTIKEYERRW